MQIGRQKSTEIIFLMYFWQQFYWYIIYCCCSVAQSCWALWDHELWHAKLPYPSPSPGVCSDSSPLSCDAIQPSHPLLSPSLFSFSLPQSFPRSQFSTSGGQSIGVSASTLVLPMKIQVWFPLGLTGLISLLSMGLSESSPAWQFECINSSALSLFYCPALTSVYDYWKNHSFD